MGLFVYSCSVPWPFVLTSYWHLLWLIGWWWYQVFLPSYVGLTLGPMKIVHPRAPGIGCTETGWWGAAATPTFVRPQDASGEDNSDVYQEDKGVVHKIVPLCSLRACFLWQNVILLYLYIYIYISYFIFWSYFIPKSVFFGGGRWLDTLGFNTSPPFTVPAVIGQASRDWRAALEHLQQLLQLGPADPIAPWLRSWVAGPGTPWESEGKTR